MIKNYFKIAFRSFRRNKLFTFINILGLSIGISAALVIYLIVHFDFTFDKFHKNGDRIYRTITEFNFQGTSYNLGVTGPMPEAAKNEVSGVESAVPFFTLPKTDIQIKGNQTNPVKFKNEDNIILADRRYFDMFKYNWLAGSENAALNAPDQVVLTSDRAAKYFGSIPYDQMIGQTILYDTIKTTVTGIVQMPEENTDFAFQDFISYSTGSVNKNIRDQMQPTSWKSSSTALQLFIKITQTATPARVEEQLNELFKRNKYQNTQDQNDGEEIHLQRLSDLHFTGSYGGFDGQRLANKTTLYGLIIIALFLLILACINFINLTTAQASTRAKEIGIRKTLGSSRKQLIIQFLSETFLLTLFAVIISIGFAPVILRLFADFIPPGVKMVFFQPYLIIFVLILIALVSFVAGFYPAIILSRFKPTSVLKNRSHNGGANTRKAVLRKSLTIAQFAVAQFFIMGTFMVSKQIYYAMHKDMGFRKEGIVIIQAPLDIKNSSRSEVLLNKIRSIPEVDIVSVGSAAPLSSTTSLTQAIYGNGKEEIKTDVQQKFGDENYIRVYNIKLLAGHNLHPADSSRSLLINATYARVLGFNNPAEAAGKFLDYDDKKMEIVGVVADFHQKSLHLPIEPLVIITRHEPKYNSTIHVALRPQIPNGHQWKDAINSMEAFWKEVYPNDDFNNQFFDENIAGFYESDQQTAKLLTWATGLSIFISCLGLLGLAIYTTNQRTKEIGVRKVLGASVMQIVSLLTSELISLVVVSFLIVCPLAWWAMSKWMENFADRTPISWWIFVLSGGGLLVITILTSAFQTVKAATATPVKSLRSE